jgi:hypothetical protein
MTIVLAHQLHGADPLIVLCGAALLLTGIVRAGRRGGG